MTRSWVFRGVLVAVVVFTLGCVVPSAPNNDNGWFFFSEGASSTGYWTNGPGTPPLGRGSALLNIDGTGREAVATPTYQGKKLVNITNLKYSTYVAFGSEAPTLAFDIDYDHADGNETYQGRLVYIPGQSTPTVPKTWQEWDTINGGPATGAWYSSASGASSYRPIVNNLTQSNPPCDQTNYCTWAEVMSNYPNARIRAGSGLLMARAGGPTTGGASAAVDNIVIGVTGSDAQVDFEPGDGIIPVKPGNAANTNFAFAQETATGSGSFVSGPTGVADGSGSARLTTDSLGGESLSTGVFAGLRVDSFTALQYKTYLQPGFAANAPTLQFDADYDDSDTSTAFQGRIVFEPSQSGGAAVTDSVWQTWDAVAATDGWWQTGTPIVGNGPVAQACTQGSPCSLSELLTAYSNLRVRPIVGLVGGEANSGRLWLKAGGGWAGGFDGNVDALTVGVNGTNATYDFEPAGA